MRQPSDPLAHFVVALPAEAKPLVAHYRLRRRIDEEAFAVFENDRISLTVSGLGKAATAAAVGYTHVLYGKHKHAVWLNVGVAGHRQAPLGSVWLGHKITDAETRRSWYPGICFRPHCPSAEIRTVARPETAYTADCLYDMESSAFFESASRFSSGELIHCLKVVSDNRDHAIPSIDPSRMASWVEGAIDVILHTKQALWRLAAELCRAETAEVSRWIERWHFTRQQQQQLGTLLRRWRLLTGHDDLPEVPPFDRSRDVLAWLRDLVDRCPVCFDRAK